MISSQHNQNAQMLKYVSLITLTIQNALLGLSMCYATSRPGPKFHVTTAVFMSEVVKCVTCLIIVYLETKSLSKFITTLHVTIIQNPGDTAKVCVPSVVYIIQNNLLYTSSSNLDAATYQVTYQLKILTTALFAVVILRKTLLKTQWASLVLLLIGVVLVQLVDSDPLKKVSDNKQNRLVGFSAALCACFLSGFAGIYFEKILKQSNISVWMRNVQLSLLSIPFGLISCYVKDSDGISENGFFYGYDLFVSYLVVLQAGGGLIVALVVKHADNILKGFATSLAIIISCIASIYLFNFHLTIQFAFGALLVICSIFMYSYQPKRPQSDKRPASLEKI
ncbi:hypothetical protein HCN44_003466 [Aphidius gifuensis]|uniref:UDP-N-acetylglucosamine transporter n=1 Tax=Aphidius gifuensis TaxID=684658 RepID=A0A835CMZ4_APHGI|nr:UDP-N-acetylglucosamine transporter [Aphidius gifuensis]XP_044019067.1 UDP-N-acetylglucosamine transporter [Aphidius gifuensis]KAF7987603.1 hypothetical protein HCN44_003466 [Aphidius gifuensis]